MKTELNVYPSLTVRKTNIFESRQMTAEEERRASLFSQKVLLSEKYRRGLKSVTCLKMKSLRATHPGISLRETLIYMLEGFNPALPPTVLQEITNFIITEWEKQPQPELAMA